MKLNESQLQKIINESLKKVLAEGWTEIPQLDEAYQNLINAIDEFQNCIDEMSEEDVWTNANAYGDSRNQPQEFFLPSNDIKMLRSIALKIKNDYKKSQTRSIDRYKRENDSLFMKS